MKSCPSPYQSETIAALIATGLAGLVTGSLAFGSFVDTRTLLALVDDDDKDKDKDKEKQKKNADFIASVYFPVWWPHGRDWMVPLTMATTVAHFLAYYCMPKSSAAGGGASTTSSTCPCQFSGNMSWIYSGLMLFGILPYTKLVMGEDIEALRGGGSSNKQQLSTEEVAASTKTFCSMHHVRTAVAASAFGLSLLSLVHLPRDSKK